MNRNTRPCMLSQKVGVLAYGFKNNIISNSDRSTQEKLNYPSRSAECRTSTVAEWLEHSPETLEVTGSCPTFAVFQRFISRIDTVSGTGLTMVCVALQELTVTCNDSGDNW